MGGRRSRQFMGEVAAYFDLDGTLLDASSEKTLTGALSLRRPWRIPLGATAWLLRCIGSLITGNSVYDSARNRGHFTLCHWNTLEKLSTKLATEKLAAKIPVEARERLQWHREQGHRLILVSATIAPMAEAMAEVLEMDAVYGCGPEQRQGLISGSEKGWSVPRRKGKVPLVAKDAQENGHDLSKCWAYGNTMADSWFMRECGHPIAINPKGGLKKFAKENGWEVKSWKV